MIGLCSALVTAVNLWIPKQPIINYINSATGGESSFDKIVMGWDWGPDIRIDGLTINGINLGDSRTELAFAQTRLKISFEALWRSLTGEEDITILNAGSDSGELTSGGIENWLIKYFQTLKVLDGAIILVNDSTEFVFTVDLFEIIAFDPESTAIVYEGSVNDVHMNLSAALADIPTLLKDNSSNVAVKGYILDETNTIYAKGTIDDLRGLGGIFLTADVAVNDPSGLVAQLHGPRLDPDIFSGISLQFDISAPDKLDSLSFSSLQAQGSVLGVDVRLFSTPSQEVVLDDMDLELEAVGKIADSAPDVIPQLAENLDVNVKGRITGSADEITFMPSKALIQGQGINARLDGKLVLADRKFSTRGTLQAEVTKDAAFISPAFEFLLPATLGSSFYGESSGLVFENVRLSSSQEVAEQARVVASGALSISVSGLNGNLVITGLFDREGLLRFRKVRLPEEIQLEAHTTLRISNSLMTLDSVDLVARMPGINLEGEASYAPSDGLDSMVVQIRGEAESAKNIGKVFRKNWPDTERVLASTVLRKSPDKGWLLDDFRVELTENHLEITADGSVRVLRSGDMGVFKISATAEQSQFMERISKSAFLQSLVSPIVPLRGTAMLYLERNSKGRMLFHLREIDIESGISRDLASATGHLDNLQSSKRQGTLGIRVRDNQGLYSSLLNAEQVEKYPILSELLEADLNLVFDGKRLLVDDFSINLLTDDARVEATGSLESLNPVITRDLNIDFRVLELSQLNRLVRDSRFQKVPAEGQLKVANSPDGSVDVHLKGKLGDQELNGEFMVDYSSSGKPDIKGYLHSNELDLEKIIGQEEREGPFFSGRDLELSWLDSINLDLELNIGRYRGPVFVLEDLSGDFRVKDGSLGVAMVGHAENKPVDMRVNLHPTESGWKTDMSIQGDDVDVDALDHNFQVSETLDSVFSIDLDLTAEGRSMSEMASRTNGRLNLEVSDTNVRVGESFLYSDLIFGMFNLILTLQSQKEFDLMECGVVNFRIQDGVAVLDNSLALKLKDFTILGSGQVELASEKLDIVFSSKARKGLGISINTVAKLFKIGGTLRNPELVADTEGLAKTGASIFAGLITGGLSIVAQGLFDREIANSDVCEVARSSNRS